MNQSSSLFKLIQSLNAGERRAITVAIKSHKYAKAYLKMFKELSLQKNYDEQKLKERLKHEPFIGHFAVVKNQLYHFILKVLRSVHESSSLEFSLKEYMLDAAILSQKALHAESWQKLQRARELALEFEDWKVLLEVLYKEFVHVSAVKGQHSLASEYFRISKELAAYTDYLLNYETLAYHYVTLLAIITEYHHQKNTAKLAEIKKLISSSILSEEKNALTLRARMIFFLCWACFYINSSDYLNARQYLIKLVNLFEENKHFIEWLPGNYLIALRDLISCNYTNRDFLSAEMEIEKLKKLSHETRIKKMQGRRFNTLILAWTFRYETGIAVALHKSQTAIYIRAQEQVFLKRISLMDANTRMETMLALASYYFYVNDTKKSVKYIEKIFADSSIEKRKTIAILATALQIIIYFTEEEEDMVDYLIKRLQSIIKAHDNISETEKKLIELCAYFPKFLKVQNKYSILKKFLDSFNSLKENDAEKIYYNFFDVTVWLSNYVKING